MRTIATAKVQRNYNCYNVYFYECLRKYRIVVLLTLEQVLDAADGAHEVRSFVRQIDGLRLVATGQFLEHLDVFLSQQVVSGIR